MDTRELESHEIYTSFQLKILRYVTLLVGEAEAEDLTQEIFVKAHQALPAFRGEAKLSTWLYRIATNAAFDRLRTPAFQRTFKNKLGDAPVEDPEAEIDDRNTWTGEKVPVLEQQIVRKQMCECIQGYVQQLPENYRSVLILSEFEELKNTEIADILGISVDTVKIRLHRAREKLKQALATHCEPYWVEENEFVPELKREKP